MDRPGCVPATPELLAKARRLYADTEGCCEVDDDAWVSEADDGDWVQAWVWVHRG